MRYILSLGSETPDKSDKMHQIIEHLGHTCRIVRITDTYLTAPVGGGTRPYLNAVAEIETEMAPQELDEYCKHLECHMGRDAAARLRGEVPADIDVVIKDDEILRPSDYQQSYFQQGLKIIKTLEQ